MFKKFENRVWLSSPTIHGEEMQFIQEAFDKNWVAPLGFNVDNLETEISKYVGCKSAAALVSGTSALHLAIKLAGVKPGDKVFCSDLTFAATVNPVSYEGAEQVFIDSEYETWNMDPKALKKAFEKYPDTKVVILVHLYGTPAKTDEILSICKEHNAILIEDAAESLGATYKGAQTGIFGKYSAISFNGNKIITSSGGGMLLSNDEEAVKKARFWATQSREPYPWYQHEEIGYNYRMSNIVAGIARGQLLHLSEHLERKEEIYRKYEEGFKDIEAVSMNPYESCSNPNFWLSCLLLDSSINVSPVDICKFLADYNVEARPIWKPMHLQPVFENCDFISVEDGLEVGTDIFNRGICLPSDIKMTNEEQDIVIEMVKSCLKQEA